MSCWCGATPRPSAEAPTHTPYNWAAFSSRVIRESRSSTRASADSARSRQGAVVMKLLSGKVGSPAAGSLAAHAHQTADQCPPGHQIDGEDRDAGEDDGREQGGDVHAE